MTPPPSLVSRAWILIPICVLGLLAWMAHARIARIEFATAQANWSVDAPVPAATSPTGYAGGVRQQLVPERNTESQEWVRQTQHMLATGNWRLRHVDYDNAPWGRETHLPALYRWWLGLVAATDHALSGRSTGLAVEHAALYAAPLLQMLLVIVTAGLAARWFGALPAALISVGLVFLFPFGGQFLPGMPDHRSLGNFCALGSILPLLAAGARARRFVAAGIAGGLGVWLGPAVQLPLLGGIALGAALASRLAPAAKNSGGGKPWRLWALSGALTILAACLVEGYPAGTEVDLQNVHPLHGLGWIALGELLAQAMGWIRERKSWANLRHVSLTILAAAVTLGLAGWMIHTHVFATDPLAQQLTSLPNGAIAGNLSDWIAQDGISAAVVATLLPLLLAIPAVVFVFRRTTPESWRAGLAIALGPVLVALLLACFQLRGWNTVDSVLLALLAGAAAAHGAMNVRAARWMWPALLALAVIPGAARLLPPRDSAELAGTEVRGLIDRDLAQWLTQRAGHSGAVVLTSPDLAAALSYYGSLRAVGTLAPENQSGATATIRMASATSFDEALALLTQRNVSYIVVPSWDATLSQYAQMGSSTPERTFIALLAQRNLPPWIRPVTYYLPTIPGYEGQEVLVFEVIDEQDPVAALSNLAEFFVETGQLDRAAAAGEKLKRYPADPGALAALAQVAFARGDRAAFNVLLAKLTPYAARDANGELAWDRRLSLAVVFVEGRRLDLARDLIQRCLAEADEVRLRSLSTNSLLRLLTLGKISGQSFADPRLDELARRLLPPTLRARL